MLPVSSIRSYGAGWSIMAATARQHCIRCSATSTDHWWRGPCGNTNALQVTGRGRVSSSRRSRRRVRIYSHTGKGGLSAGSPDGSCVRRESHAQFYERPGVQFLRPTHHKGAWTIHCYAHDILRFTTLRMSIDVLQNGEWVVGGHVQLELMCQARAEVNFDAPEARIIIHDNQVMTCMEAIALGLHDAPGVGAARRLIARHAQHPGFGHLLPWGLIDDPLALIQY